MLNAVCRIAYTVYLSVRASLATINDYIILAHEFLIWHVIRYSKEKLNALAYKMHSASNSLRRQGNNGCNSTHIKLKLETNSISPSVKIVSFCKHVRNTAQF